jgi:hypothetical protein
MRTTNWNAGLAGIGLALAMSATGCKNNQPAQVANDNNGPDPAAANLATVDTAATTPAPAPSRVLSSRSSAQETSSGEQYGSNAGIYDSGNYDADNDQQYYADQGQAAIYANDPPPPLPEYQQPELTEPGYEWTPGYWNYGSGGYYWVPGAWVAPPYQGALWTPGYWGQNGGRYDFHRGYWARHIGFYGGIDYGFGYGGFGYQGGYWNNDRFYYNNAVNHVNVNVVRTVYEHNVTVNNTYNRISFNGPHGVPVRPRPQEVAVLHEQRLPPMQVQQQRVQAAAQNRDQFYAANHGKPAVAAAPEHLAADRTPPAAIRPAPSAAQRGGFGERLGEPVQQHPEQTQRPAAQEQNQQRNAQMQQEQQRQQEQRTAQVQQQQRQQQAGRQHVAQEQQRQAQQQRQVERQRQVPPQRAVPEQRQEQRQAQPTRPEVQPRPDPQVRPEQPRPQQAPRPQEQPRPEAQPRPQSQPRPQEAPHEAPRPEEHPHR